MRVLEAEKAATEVFNTLTEVESDRGYVKHIGTVFSSQQYDPVETGNALLVYGQLSPRWFKPEDQNTRRALRQGLQTIFEVSLSENGGSKDPELEFVRFLGSLVQRLADSDQHSQA